MGAGDQAVCSPLSPRDGCALVRTAGLDGHWSMPIAVWHAPDGFDTSNKPDNQPHNTIAVRLDGSLVQRVKINRVPIERLSPDGFSVHPAGQDLRFVAQSEIRFAHLYVSERYLRHVCAELHTLRSEGSRIMRDDCVMYRDDEMRQLIRAYIARAFDDVDTPSRLEMDSLANLMVLRLVQKHSSLANILAPPVKTGTLPNWQLRRVCDYMDTNLHKEIALADVAELIGISTEHFCRSFRRSTGMPPHRWVIQRRIAKAQVLMADPSMTLTDIAQEVGYTGQSAFGAAFRKVTGVTPRQYRRTL